MVKGPSSLAFILALQLISLASIHAYGIRQNDEAGLNALVTSILDNEEAIEDEDLVFTAEDEESLIADMVDQGLEEYFDGQIDDERQLRALRSNGRSAGLRSKRFTVEFNGMQVSYPTYIRLNRMRKKAIRLQKIIQALRVSLPPEERGPGSDFQRLLALYSTLKPLLPKNLDDFEEDAQLEVAQGIEEKRTMMADDDVDEEDRDKRFNVPFKGMSVTLPQYLRLKSLQDKAMKLDTVMQNMMESQSIEHLNRIPKWHSLVELHAGLKHMLPDDYQAGDFSATLESDNHASMIAMANQPGGSRSKRSIQDARLADMQDSALRLDSMMRQLVKDVGHEKLASMPRWNRLVTLRQDLNGLMPKGAPAYAARSKKGAMMEFRGLEVTYPQYLHLIALEEKVAKMDAVMNKIRAAKSESELVRDPKWQKLSALRKALVKLLPM